MTLRSSQEISEISQHIDGLRRQFRLDRSRQWWPAFLFHCTDITNAISILSRGELLSRTQAEDTGQLQRDIASPEIISGTDEQWQDYARLYFRPKTPTQYRNEGFRPVNQRELNSHCPVPVYLLFDALEVLSRADSLFTSGNLGSPQTIPSGDIEILKQIPFDTVYHSGYFNPAVPNDITYHRNAEVLVPKRLTLNSLRAIGCRSTAEHETLLYLLPPNTLSRWVDKIHILPGLFNRKWTFVEQVEKSNEQVIFRFNRSSETPGPFDARAELTDQGTRGRNSWIDPEHLCRNDLALPVNHLSNPPDYTVHLFLDDQLAYANRYQEEDLPF